MPQMSRSRVAIAAGLGRVRAQLSENEDGEIKSIIRAIESWTDDQTARMYFSWPKAPQAPLVLAPVPHFGLKQ